MISNANKSIDDKNQSKSSSSINQLNDQTTTSKQTETKTGSANINQFNLQSNTSQQVQQLKTKQEVVDQSQQVENAIQLHTLANQISTNTLQRKENKTGLPDNLKSGVENLSGLSMDHVKVHYNSDKPAQLNAHAYAQGSEIHVGQGQEKHLPHEAWHVVQQMQDRVKPTVQMKGNLNVNDDSGLEHEADIMGQKSLSTSEPIQKRTSSKTSTSVFQLNKFSFKGIRGKKPKPEFVPESDTTAFSDEKATKIKTSMIEAYKMTNKAKSKVDKNNIRYKKFMDGGKVNPEGVDARLAHVKSGFDKIGKCLEEDTLTFEKYALDDGEEEDTFAYVHSGANERKIYLGGAFWDAKVKGYDSKAGTIIHELTHELHDTDDHVYGQEGALDLAKNEPEKAVTNADNYENFAEKA